jgi:predicted Rossmann fold nucleotide-binding protein DprA/Smf involved in DNA uptake
MQNKYIGIIGSRQLDLSHSNKVFEVTKYFLDNDYFIASGGALGADQFCLEALLKLNKAEKGLIFSAWENIYGFPAAVRGSVREFIENDGRISWGTPLKEKSKALINAAIFQRNKRLIANCSGLVVFLSGASRGSLFTLQLALQKHIPVIVFPRNYDLPNFKNITWETSSIFPNSFQARFIYV